MILVAVGTFVHGFDALVEAADEAVAALGAAGFAQIGHGRYLPRRMRWARFLPAEAFRARLREARIVVCHGGIGIIGEAMRAGRPIVAVPRRGSTTRRHPANDQTAFLARLGERFPITVCADPANLKAALGRCGALGPQHYALGSDVPELVARYLAGSTVR